MRRVIIVALLVGVASFSPAVGQAQTETVSYYHTDAIGSVRMVTDEAGQVVARYDYQPFGLPLLQDPQPPPERRQFAGKERDTETNFDYFGGRYYASGYGRFTTVDPGHVNGDIYDPQSWNGYAYARNNPLRFTDPDGREYEICVEGAPGCQSVSDQRFRKLLNNPGAGIQLFGGYIYAGGKGVGTYQQTSIDPTSADFFRLTGELSSRWLREQSTQMAVGAAIAATGGLAAGAVSGGLAAESLSITSRALNVNKLHHIFGNAGHNLGPLVARFGSQEAAYAAVEKATQAAVRSQGFAGVYRVNVHVGGQALEVTGKVVNGVARIGTFYIR